MNLVALASWAFAAALGQLPATDSAAAAPMTTAPSSGGPRLAAMPACEVWGDETWPVETLARWAASPQTVLAVATRSNMVRPELAALLARQPAALLQIRPPLSEAHVEQLRRLSRVTLALEVPERPGPELASRLTHLGPQMLRLRVARLDEARARWLGRFKNAEVELDLRGRVPDQEELALLRSLARLRRVVRLSADAPPELVSALGAARLARVVLDEGEPPAALLAAVAELGVPARAVVAAPAGRNLGALAALSGLTCELPLADGPGTTEAWMSAVRAGFGAAAPPAAKP